MSSPQPSCPQKLQRETGRTRKPFYASSGAEHFEGKFWQKPDLFDLWAVSEKMLVSFRNMLSGVVNTAFHMSREKLWDKSVFFLKKVSLTFFSDLEWRKSGFLGEDFKQVCQRPNSRDQRKFLVKLYYEEYTTLNLLTVFLRERWFARRLQVRQ